MRAFLFHYYLLLPALVTGLISPSIVVLIPAYNEANRIGSTLESYQDTLTASPWECEIVVVDDGSSDLTFETVQQFSINGKIPIQCISLDYNQGKGAAISKGIEFISDTKTNDSITILTQDADGSGDLKYLDSMLENMERLTNSLSNPALVTGNRNYKLWSARGITRWGFQTCVSIIMGGLGVQDTQCGYKLMTLPAAKLLYTDLNLKGWAHDVEVLFRAKLLQVPLAQINIDWQDKDGSKVVESGVVKVSTEMLLDIIRLRWKYSITKAWKPPPFGITEI